MKLTDTEKQGIHSYFEAGGSLLDKRRFLLFDDSDLWTGLGTRWMIPYE